MNELDPLKISAAACHPKMEVTGELIGASRTILIRPVVFARSRDRLGPAVSGPASSTSSPVMLGFADLSTTSTLWKAPEKATLLLSSLVWPELLNFSEA
jgi:hypothetical protein